MIIKSDDFTKWFFAQRGRGDRVGELAWVRAFEGGTPELIAALDLTYSVIDADYIWEAMAEFGLGEDFVESTKRALAQKEVDAGPHLRDNLPPSRWPRDRMIRDALRHIPDGPARIRFLVHAGPASLDHLDLLKRFTCFNVSRAERESLLTTWVQLMLLQGYSSDFLRTIAGLQEDFAISLIDAASDFIIADEGLNWFQSFWDFYLWGDVVYWDALVAHLTRVGSYPARIDVSGEFFRELRVLFQSTKSVLK